MALISSYPLLTPQLGDKILGSNTVDSSGTLVSNNPTCQYNFTDVKALVDQNYISQLDSSSTTTTQGPTAVDTLYSVRFGAAAGAATSNVQLLQGTGVVGACDKIQFNETGTYQITLTYLVGVAGSSGNIPYLVFRTLQDGTTQIGPTIVYNQKFEATLSPVPLIIPLTVNITKACYYNFQFIRHLVNDGGLVKNGAPINVTTIIEPQVANIKISKLT